MLVSLSYLRGLHAFRKRFIDFNGCRETGDYLSFMQRAHPSLSHSLNSVLAPKRFKCQGEEAFDGALIMCIAAKAQNSTVEVYLLDTWFQKAYRFTCRDANIEVLPRFFGISFEVRFIYVYPGASEEFAIVFEIKKEHELVIRTAGVLLHERKLIPNRSEAKLDWGGEDDLALFEPTDPWIVSE